MMWAPRQQADLSPVTKTPHVGHHCATLQQADLSTGAQRPTAAAKRHREYQRLTHVAPLRHQTTYDYGGAYKYPVRGQGRWPDLCCVSTAIAALSWLYARYATASQHSMHFG